MTQRERDRLVALNKAGKKRITQNRPPSRWASAAERAAEFGAEPSKPPSPEGEGRLLKQSRILFTRFLVCRSFGRTTRSGTQHRFN